MNEKLMTRLVALHPFAPVWITVGGEPVEGMLAGLRFEDRGVLGIVESKSGNRYVREAGEIEALETVPAGERGEGG